MKIYCTICSAEKDLNPELLSAIDRYRSPRIRSVYEKSRSDGVGFRILSGEFGLLKPKDKIPYYDHLLIPQEIDEMVSKVAQQLSIEGIKQIKFFTRKKISWNPYLSVIEQVTKSTEIQLEISWLD